jgi:nitroreductase
MEIDKAIRRRRSIRKYQGRDISNSVIEELLGLAICAPSSMNGQPWHFIIIRDKTIGEQLVEIKNKYCPVEKREYQADFLRQAPVIIMVCVNKEKSFDREIENGVLAAANLMLGAYSRGIGSVYLSAHRVGEPNISREIRNILNIPNGVDPISLIPLGYPDEIPETKNFIPLEKAISYETFGQK